MCNSLDDTGGQAEDIVMTGVGGMRLEFRWEA